MLRLRAAGVLLPELRPPEEWHEGFVSLETTRPAQRTGRTTLVAEFRGFGDSHLVPPARLFEPVLTGLAHGTILLRGIERVTQGRKTAAVLQEWRLDAQRVIPPGGTAGPPLGELPATR